MTEDVAKIAAGFRVLVPGTYVAAAGVLGLFANTPARSGLDIVFLVLSALLVPYGVALAWRDYRNHLLTQSGEKSA